MLMKLISSTSIAIIAVSAAGAAQAQTAPTGQNQPAATGQTQPSAAGQDRQTAGTCLPQLAEFGQRMNDNEFWIAGWGARGYGGAPVPQSTRTPGNVAGESGATGTAPTTGMTGGAATGTDGVTGTGQTAGTTEATPGATDGAMTGGMANGTSVTGDPRGDLSGVEAPRGQILALNQAARVLAHRGDDEGCSYLVTKMNEVYDGYAEQLQQAGVDPASVTTWRQEQLALARPLAGDDDAAWYRLDDLTGTDVRNVEDENLGSVNDVVFDPQSGQVTHVIVARGGFLGFGEDHYAIPIDAVHVTAGLETVVIDRSESEVENAPTIDPDRMRNPQTMMEERRETDEFWTRDS